MTEPLPPSPVPVYRFRAGLTVLPRHRREDSHLGATDELGRRPMTPTDQSFYYNHAMTWVLDRAPLDPEEAEECAPRYAEWFVTNQTIDPSFGDRPHGRLFDLWRDDPALVL